MKKMFILLTIAAAVYACNSGSDKKAGQSAEASRDTAQAKPAAAAGNEKGLELVASNDCTTCHAIDKKVTGPAYRDVANKYESNEATIDSLAAKVIKGGSGVWGNIPMTPHPALSEADAKEMVKYVLSLKNK